MSLRSLRARLALVSVGLAALVLVGASALSPVGASARDSQGSTLLTQCVKQVIGVGQYARPVSGSAGPQVISELAILRRPRSSADPLPRAAKLREALGAAGARTYDPSRAIRLMRIGAAGGVYAVPATVSAGTLPADCRHLPQFAGVEPYLALHGQQTGDGPGVCLLKTAIEENLPSAPPLPGQATPTPTRTLTAQGAECESSAVLTSYYGTLGSSAIEASGAPLALVPDGVRAITYSLANGDVLTVPVAGNIARSPLPQTVVSEPTPAGLRGQLTADLPTTVTESGVATATLARPATLISDFVAGNLFLGRLLRHFSQSSSSVSELGVSCSARTHRCVAVTVTTTCNRGEHCQTTRRIYHYRYVGARPPRGATGRDTLPIQPIRARVNQLITRPGKLTLVLTGTPHRHVQVLLSVACFAGSSGASGGGSPLELAVPSRTAITLPGPARSFHACDVGALVVSGQRGPVQATVVRGGPATSTTAPSLGGRLASVAGVRRSA